MEINWVIVDLSLHKQRGRNNGANGPNPAVKDL